MTIWVPILRYCAMMLVQPRFWFFRALLAAFCSEWIRPHASKGSFFQWCGNDGVCGRRSCCSTSLHTRFISATYSRRQSVISSEIKSIQHQRSHAKWLGNCCWEWERHHNNRLRILREPNEFDKHRSTTFWARHIREQYTCLQCLVEILKTSAWIPRTCVLYFTSLLV